MAVKRHNTMLEFLKDLNIELVDGDINNNTKFQNNETYNVEEKSLFGTLLEQYPIVSQAQLEQQQQPAEAS